jgi:hypothetical protein
MKKAVPGGYASDGWHPSYDDLVAAAGCPVCGAAAGYDCPVPPGGRRDIHIDRILLARGIETGEKL